MRIVFATGNSKKLEEAREYLEPLGHDVELLLIEGKPPNFMEPQTSELMEVALSKSDQVISMISESEICGSEHYHIFLKSYYSHLPNLS